VYLDLQEDDLVAEVDKPDDLDVDTDCEADDDRLIKDELLELDPIEEAAGHQN
jgi:hypothetical protein